MNNKSHWEQIYSDKSPLEVSWYQTEPRLSLELIAATGLGPEAALIDVGGGASVLVDRLLAQGYRKLAVLDISAQALAHARQRLGEDGAKVEWYEADITTFAAPHGFDVWHDRAVFHFLTDAEDRQRYVEVLRRSLNAGGQVIIAAFAIGGPEMCSGLPIVQYDAAKLAQELGADFRLLEMREETHITPANKPQHFGYFRFGTA
jgi:SAM-dependent methyltransferase